MIIKIIELQAQIESLQESAQVWVNVQFPNHVMSDREVLEWNLIRTKEFPEQKDRDSDREVVKRVA